MPLVRPAMTETTALGAAFLAGLDLGFWKNMRDLAREERRFEIRLPRYRADAIRLRWNEAVSRAEPWERLAGNESRS